MAELGGLVGFNAVGPNNIARPEQEKTINNHNLTHHPMAGSDNVADPEQEKAVNNRSLTHRSPAGSNNVVNFEQESIYWQKKDNLVSAIYPLKSVYGEKRYALRVKATNLISAHSQKNTLIILWLIFTLGICGFAVIYLIAHQHIFSPLLKLEKHIKEIENTGNLELIGVTDCDDEISALSR